MKILSLYKKISLCAVSVTLCRIRSRNVSTGSVFRDKYLANTVYNGNVPVPASFMIQFNLRFGSESSGSGAKCSAD
jgi:hypothetical protein